MAEPNDELPTRDELARLPPSAIVAYAARCARRVQPLYAMALPVDFPDLQKHCAAIDQAIALAEQWANAKDVSDNTLSDAARAVDAARDAAASFAAVHANVTGTAHSAAYAASRATYTALRAATTRTDAADSAGAVGVDATAAAAANGDTTIVVRAARTDFAVLEARDFQPKDTVDATERGVCGPLWKGEPPRWYVDGQTRLREFGVPKKTARRRRPAPTKSDPAANDQERKQLIAEIAQLRDQLNLRSHDYSDFRGEVERNLKQAQSLQADAERRAAEQETLRVAETQEHQDTRHELLKLRSDFDQIGSRKDTVEEQLKHAQILCAEAGIEATEQEKNRVAEATAHQETKATLLKVQQDNLKLQQDKVDLEGKLSLIATERDLLKVQPLAWYGKLFFRPQNIFRLLTLLVLGVMVLFALLSISEVYERQALDRWVKTKADEQRDRLANGAVGNLANSATPQRRQEYDTIRSRLLVLSFAGATTPSETVGGIRDVLLQEVVLQAVLTNDDGTRAATKPASGKATESSWWHWLCHWLSYQSSDLLLSLVILFSGTVGAVVTTLRKDQPLTLRDLGQGLAAGFITFLVIRGGKSIFLLDADPLLLINPYNSAFMGLLAGMFTELAYELLTSVAQEIANRLKVAFDPNNGNSNRSHSSPANPLSEPLKPASGQNPARDEGTPAAAASAPSQPE